MFDYLILAVSTKFIGALLLKALDLIGLLTLILGWIGLPYLNISAPVITLVSPFLHPVSLHHWKM